MPKRKAVGGRAVTEQMGAASAALLELNEQWITYLRGKKEEAAGRLRATGDLDEVLAGLGTPAGQTAGVPLDEAAGISPWAVAAGPDGWDPAAAPAEAAADPAPGGLWAEWAAAGEPVIEETTETER